MHVRFPRLANALALAVVAALTLSACASIVDGKPQISNAPNAQMDVVGGASDSFDTAVKNALSDVLAFWKREYPKVSGGKSLPPLKGGLYSVDGLKVAEDGHAYPPIDKEGCIQQSADFIIDNGAFCLLDDSIAWDRSSTHLFAQLAQHYGELMVALIFAHEVGHAISYRLGVFDSHPPTIDTESQADCAAGAWAASALAHQDPHYQDVTPQKLDDALAGFLDGRDKTPNTPADVSHGNGFDRLSALADGIDRGVTYCYSKGYFASRHFTERPFTSEADYEEGGNASPALTTDPNGFLVKDQNRFWTAAAKEIKRTFQTVKASVAPHPKCGATADSQFGYCPDDNTVYFSKPIATQAYNSLPGVVGDPNNGNIKLVFNQPADFALGTLFAIGWGMAVRHQLFHRELTDGPALLSAVCYTGAYAKDVNLASDPNVNDPAKRKFLLLSPADLDEAVSALLNRDLLDKTYGTRGTTGLDRIQSFVKGYSGGLSSC